MLSCGRSSLVLRNKGDATFFVSINNNWRMPRLSRTIFAGVPHHVTQRGNRREDVFFSEEDRSVYLGWLKAYCDKYKVEILAYCLMTNHIHLIAVSASEDGLQKILKPLHMRYAQRINRNIRLERPSVTREVLFIPVG